MRALFVEQSTRECDRLRINDWGSSHLAADLVRVDAYKYAQFLYE